MRRNGSWLTVLCSLALIGCSLGERESATAPIDARGAVSLRFPIDAASPFKSIARSGTLTVSAADMQSMSAPLMVGDSDVVGEIFGIPAGKQRSIVVKVFGQDGILGYQGSGLADIFPDKTTRVEIDLVRTTGSLLVSGRIIEGATAWPAPTDLTLGAQASAAFGAALDADSAEAWTSARANADPEGIDLVCLFYDSKFHLDNAVAAREAGIAHSINLTTSYEPARIQEVRIVKLASRPVDQESGKRVFASGAKIRGSAVSAGELFLLESTGGRLVLLTVLRIVGTDKAGSIEVRLERSTLP